MGTALPSYAANNLEVQLGGQPILRNLSFTIAAGEWIALLGPNGSGKTTLLRALGGLLPYAGSLTLQDKPVADWKERDRAKAVAFVRQHAQLSFDFSVYDVVALGLSPHVGWLERPSEDFRDRVEQALKETDLVELRDRSVSTLSGGEQQRVQLAQALVQNTDILLLDEPTAHLDVHHQYDLMERIAAQSSAGKTIVSAFHDLEFAARYADRLLVLDKGQLVRFGTPTEVLTPELIRSVFRMDVEVESSFSNISINYLSPIH